MKTRIKKIIIMAVAILFVSVGVSFAQDLKNRQHKTRGNAYGHYKKGYDHHTVSLALLSRVDLVFSGFGPYSECRAGIQTLFYH